MLQSEQEKLELADRLRAIHGEAARLATRRDEAASEALHVLELLRHKLATSPGKQVSVVIAGRLAAERLRAAGKRFASVAGELDELITRQRQRAMLRGGAR